MQRRHNFQGIAWFWDLHQRELLELDPPYQRRSVWNQAYKDSFIETILLGYPAPAIFLYEDIQPSGRAQYNVVDGKQRLVTIFEFASDLYAVSDKCPVSALSGMYFRDMPDDEKRAFWGYQFLVEYLPTSAENVINDIFDRINKNVAKLTPQELRHARFSGQFIQASEELAEWLSMELPDFPRIVAQSKRQMKDVQLVADLLLMIERAPRGYSQSELDEAFSERDETWDDRLQVESTFRDAIAYIKELLGAADGLRTTRLRNQVDFYALVAAVVELQRGGALAPAPDAGPRLEQFIRKVDSEDDRRADDDLRAYFEAARSAAGDTGNRKKRTEILAKVLR
ncbi:MAG: DUF262 domain-containing protein [Polyangiaceae bacterium]